MTHLTHWGLTWQHRTESTLAQVMAWCLTQCWLIISEVLWHSTEGNFIGTPQNSYPWSEFDKIREAFHRGQWVNFRTLSLTLKKSYNRHQQKGWEQTFKSGPKIMSVNSLTSRRCGCNINSSLPGQNGFLFADDIFRCILRNEKFCISIKISLKFVAKFPIDNNLALLQIMAWRRIGDKPLSRPMLTRFTDIYVALGGDELNVHISNTQLWLISLSFFCGNALRWIPQDPTDYKSALVHIFMAPSHHLNYLPYDIAGSGHINHIFARYSDYKVSKKGKCEGFDSCDQLSNFVESSIFRFMWPRNLMDDLEKQ